jgi:hypothetical protein
LISPPTPRYFKGDLLPSLEDSTWLASRQAGELGIASLMDLPLFATIRVSLHRRRKEH